MSHLLIVDSDQNLRADVCNFFRGIGQVIEEAPDYPTALKMIEAVAFDIIISDVIIPGGTIRDLIKAIHSNNNAYFHKRKTIETNQNSNI